LAKIITKATLPTWASPRQKMWGVHAWPARKA